MTKNYWTLGHYSRFQGDFTYTGKFNTAQEACASVGMKAWTYDSKTQTYIPFKENQDSKRAECGMTNTNLENTYKVAFKFVVPDITLTSKTKLIHPNQTRKTIGVGETITIYSNTPVTWSVTSNLVRVSRQTSKTITLVAADKAGTVTISAKN